MTESRQLIPGSERSASGTALGPIPDDAPVQATLVLRRRRQLEPGAALTPQQLGERYGADPTDLEDVRRALSAAGIRIVEEHAGSRRVRVEGTAAAMSGLFGTRLTAVERTDGVPQKRMRTGALSVPSGLGAVTAVLGMDDRPVAATRHIVASPEATTASFTPLQLAEIYQIPEADGAGQTIAIIELGGGFGSDDLDHYFAGLGLSSPSVTAVGVDGADNQPGKDPQGADGEVLLDIEVAGAIAPKAAIVVYFAPNSDAGFVDAISTAAHASPTPASISISWGQSEDQWTGQARTAMDQAIADATAMGITVTAAAGDNGSADAPSGSGKHADFPASSPHALGCGGTRLEVSGSTITETVWNDGGRGGATGGGVSDVFDRPDWQGTAGVPGTGRGVPDVAAVADPQTGYQVYVDGRAMVIGGTSAVAPLWAGICARLAQLCGRPTGQLQTVLYAGAAPATGVPLLRDITEGSNGAYDAGPGWDACTGLGVPSAGLASLTGSTQP
ncbi:MAG TPA: S53 family peptidase [Nocardioides sp.]|nr:S53 family peptidase [Nocardioides sp.]